MGFDLESARPLFDSSSASPVKSTRAQASNSSPQDAFLSFLGQKSGGGEVQNIDRFIGGQFAGIPGAMAASRGSQLGGGMNMEDLAPLIGSMAGRALGTQVGHPIIGGSLGAGAGEGFRQMNQGLRAAVNGQPGPENPAGAMGMTAGLNMATDGAFSLMTKAPFAGEYAQQALTKGRKILQANKNALVKTGATVPKSDILANLSNQMTNLQLPSEVSKFNTLVLKEIKDVQGDVGIQQLISLSEKINAASGNLYKKGVSGAYKTAVGDTRAYFSKLIKDVAKKNGIEGFEESVRNVASANRHIKFLGGSAGSTGTVVGGISGLGSLGALIGSASGHAALGGMVGSLGGAALSNPVIRNVLFRLASNPASRIAQEVVRQGINQGARQIAYEA